MLVHHVKQWLTYFDYYDTIIGTIIKLLTTSNTEDTYFKTDVDVCLSILQAGIVRRVGSNVVDIDGRFNINGVSNAISKTQQNRWFNCIRFLSIIS